MEYFYTFCHGLVFSFGVIFGIISCSLFRARGIEKLQEDLRNTQRRCEDRLQLQVETMIEILKHIKEK